MTETENPALERSALIVATLTSFMGPFMFSSVNVALPAIQSEFSMNAVQLSWIATAYLLAVAVGLIPAGKIADIYGRKKVFATGLAVYTLAAGIAVFVNSAVTFIALRVFQGMGAAMFVTTGMAILTSIFPPNRRGKVIGIYVAAVYIGLSAGPFVGGILTEQFGWHSIFIAIVPMGAFSLLLTLRFLQGEWLGERGQQVDVAGCLLYAATVLCLVCGATRLPSALGWCLLFAGVLLLYAFIKHQLAARFPVIDVHLFVGNKAFAYSSLAALLNYSATFAITFLLSLYLQFVKGMSAQTAGTVLMAQPVVMAILSPVAGRLSDRIEPRFLATAGMSITVTGVLLFSQLHRETDLHLIILNLTFLGTGFALFSSPNMSAIMGAVEKRYYGVASGTVATMRLLGQMFSMALATVVMSIIIGQQAISAENQDLLMQCIRTVFIMSACLSLSGVYFSWFRGKVIKSGP